MLKKTLLLVNSSQVLMDITKRILERAGYSVRCAIGFAGARELLMSYEPDGIILESHLPDGDGIDFCRELCDEYAMPVLFLSNDKDDELPALQAGSADYLKKPFDYDILKARLSIMLNSKISVFPEIDDEQSSGDGGFTEPHEERYGKEQDDNVLRDIISVSTKQKTPTGRKGIYMAAAACLLVLLLGIGGLFLFNNRSPYSEIPEADVPLGAFPISVDKNAKPYAGDDAIINYPGINDVTMPAGATNMELLLVNPADNQCGFTFTLVLSDTGEQLYTSEIVEPGMCIEEVGLARGLEKGLYGAIMRISAYTPGNIATPGIAEIEFLITAI